VFVIAGDRRRRDRCWTRRPPATFDAALHGAGADLGVDIEAEAAGLAIHASIAARLKAHPRLHVAFLQHAAEA